MNKYSKLSLADKLTFHEERLKAPSKINSIISAQATTVCIRNIKQAAAHQLAGVNVHLLHSGNAPNDFYGYGNEFYASITRVHKKIKLNWARKITSLAHNTSAQLIHTHNEPDLLPMHMMMAETGIPVIYDQHDFLSGKKKSLRHPLEIHERYCNENNDGAIFITDYYRDLVSKKYRINPLNISYPNYGSRHLLVSEADQLPKLSAATGKTHIVYEGALDDQHPGITRYLVSHIQKLSDMGFHVDLYPSKNEEYLEYKRMKNVRVFEKHKPTDLMKQLTQYDFGLTLVNTESVNMPDELRFGFWNKTFDYLLAGIPQISLEMFDVSADFIRNNNYGIVVKTLSELKDHAGFSPTAIDDMQANILRDRESYTTEVRSQQMHQFYQDVLQNFHQRKIQDLSSH